MSTKEATECHWVQEDDGETWATQCANLFAIIDGTPSENKMRFCCYCGKPLIELRFEDEVLP